MKCQTLHHDMSISAKLGESDNASILSADTRNGAKAANAIDDNDNKWLSDRDVDQPEADRAFPQCAG